MTTEAAAKIGWWARNLDSLYEFLGGRVQDCETLPGHRVPGGIRLEARALHLAAAGDREPTEVIVDYFDRCGAVASTRAWCDGDPRVGPVTWRTGRFRSKV
jgi:hypothetical protein